MVLLSYTKSTFPFKCDWFQKLKQGSTNHQVLHVRNMFLDFVTCKSVLWMHLNVYLQLTCPYWKETYRDEALLNILNKNWLLGFFLTHCKKYALCQEIGVHVSTIRKCQCHEYTLFWKMKLSLMEDICSQISDAVASDLQVSYLYKSDLQVSSRYAINLMWFF